MSNLISMLGINNLCDASLFTSPPERVFECFGDLYANAQAQFGASKQRDVDSHDWLFGAYDLVGIGDNNYKLTHSSLQQICNHAHIRMRDLKRLTPETAKRVLNELWPRKHEVLRILTEGSRLRSVNSQRYERLWDYEVLQQIEKHLIPSGFTPACPTVGAGASNALVRGESAMFAAFYKNQVAYDTGDFGGLRRGILVYNGETGERSFGYEHFIFREVSSSMIFWGGGEFAGKQHKHFRNVRETFADFSRFVALYESNMLTSELELIQIAQETNLVSDGNLATETKRELMRLFDCEDDIADKIIQYALLPNIGDGTLSVWSLANAAAAHGNDQVSAESRITWQQRAGALLTRLAEGR